jgi:hypothetical protein
VRGGSIRIDLRPRPDRLKVAITSVELLPELELLPASSYSWSRDLGSLRSELSRMDSELWSVEFGLGIEEALEALFAGRNVPDDLTRAYEAAFTSSQQSLAAHYSEILDLGDAATRGFISNLKGKLAEVRLTPALEDEFPGYRFELAAHANQPDWDILGSAPPGAEDIVVQIKLGDAGYASQVAERMEARPDIPFAVSSEIREAILRRHPELAPQIIDLEFSNLQVAAEVHDGLFTLASNYGLDVPDKVGDWLPYVGELFLGVRMVLDVQNVRREFAAVPSTDRRRVHALRCLALLSRFAVSGAAVGAGAAAGMALQAMHGALLGAGLGAGVAGLINRALRPHVLELGMWLVGVTADDLFHFRNKPVIDRLSLAFWETART